MNFTISYAVYPYEVFVAFENDKKKFYKSIFKILKKKYHSEVKYAFRDHKFGVNTHARTLMTTGGHTIILMSKFEDTIAHQATLSHEIFHAVHFLMDRLQIPLSMDNAEAYAYLIQYLTTEIYKNIIKK